MGNTQITYDRFDAAFARINAYAILDSERRHIALMAFKYPKDGAGRCRCFLHFFGVEMVSGSTGGFGYDKAAAAVEQAAMKLGKKFPRDEHIGPRIKALTDALTVDTGQDWERRLEAAGFIPCRAI